MMVNSISIIVPVYGRVSLLDACLGSCRASSYAPFEILVVDDGNAVPDSTLIAGIASRHGATVIRTEQNRGAAAARNSGAKAAHGDLLFFADADIVLAHDALQHLVEALCTRPAAAFAYGDYQLQRHLMRAQDFSVEQLKKQNYISTMSLIRRDAFAGFDETLRRFQDWDLWLSITDRGGQGVYVPRIIARISAAGSISAWIPSWVARHARWFLWIPRVRSYETARRVIQAKHKLVR
jgi:glycosyltransferase involved in cell wall biosynthesis